MQRWGIILAAGLLLGACANTNPGEMPAALSSASTATPQAAPSDPPPKPIEKHEASAQCWMQYDKTPGSLETKAKLVDKCIDAKLKGETPK